MKKVSIIIPIYNAEKYIKKSLDSVINQTLKDIEIILIDDGSTDSSPQICDEYAKNDTRIHVVHKINEGMGAAYNTGLKLAQGEYIGFIESDDFPELNMYQDLYNLAMEYDADIVKSDWYSYWDIHGVKNEKRDILKCYPENKIINAKSHPWLLCVQASIWSGIYKRDFIEKFAINFLESPGASYQDISFTLKAFSTAKKIIITHNAYVHYRLDNEASSVKSKGKVFAVCGEFDEVDKYLTKHNINNKSIMRHKWLIQYYLYLWNLDRIADEYKSDFKKVFADTFSQAFKKRELDNEFFQKVNIVEFSKITDIKPEDIFYRNMPFLAKIFSVRNMYIGDKKIKLITIFGFIIKIKKVI